MTTYAIHTFHHVKDLPDVMAYRHTARAQQVSQDTSDIQAWRQRNGYDSAAVHTLCTDLMIFAQFDARLPFATLNISPRRLAPPESVLPELARRGDLLLICPLPSIGSPAWVEFYRYWSSPESHSDLSEKWGKFPLREVGRIRQYIIYRVEPELASAN